MRLVCLATQDPAVVLTRTCQHRDNIRTLEKRLERGLSLNAFISQITFNIKIEVEPLGIAKRPNDRGFDDAGELRVIQRPPTRH